MLRNTRSYLSLLFISFFLFVNFVNSEAAERTWTGGGANALASTAANWSDNTVPIEGDDIILNSTSEDKDMTWNLDISVQSWSQNDYNGTVTFTMEYTGSFTNLHIIGDCVINSGTWTHRGPQVLETNRLSVSIGGDLTIGTNGEISAMGKGYRVSTGPGKGTGSCGGSYGGTGINGGQCYGCAVEPVNLGSGGSSPPGGGAIQLFVNGASTIDGSLNANGGEAGGAGSGGSVLFRTESLSGAGEIKAEGGHPTMKFMGGGGRVSVALTGDDEDFSGFFGEISAFGGLYGTGRTKPGTVYLEEGNDLSGGGELIVDNLQSTIGGYGNNTALNGLNVANYHFKRITLKENSVLEINAGATLNITGTVLDLANTANGFWIAGATVIFPNDFSFTDYFIGVRGENTVFSPGNTFTVGSGAELRLDKHISMNRSLIVEDGGLVTHTINPASHDENYKIDLELFGSLTIETSGAIDVSARGFPPNYGPGSHPIDTIGGSYGGKARNGMPCYGSLINPTNLGSAGRSGTVCFGGGAIILKVFGTIENSGGIFANSLSQNRVGSGGTVNITAGNLTGSGPIVANSGDSSAGSIANPGGGGRIAISLTEPGADIFAYKGPITAYGAYNSVQPGGAGTIYLRNPGQALNEGTLIIDNNNNAGEVTEISEFVDDACIGKVLIRNQGHLRVNDEQSLVVSESWNNQGVFTGGGSGTVIFNAPEGESTSVDGDTVFSRLICTNSKQTIVFKAGSTTSIASYGFLELRGDSDSNLALKSSNQNSLWNLVLGPDSAHEVEYVD
ncbi:MAG: hypothetical protein GX811_02240, partial [Lentisphaerae bacterium]|nr:hypothetical protein [Lentisphaerota bacterium]